MIMRWAALVVLGAAMFAQAPLSAQARPILKGRIGKGAPKADQIIQRLQRMSPQERERFLSKLEPERRRNLERRLRALQEMTPEERRRAARALDEFRSLPPERQMQVRRLFRRLEAWPEERRSLLSEEVRSFRDLSAEERRARLTSEEYRGRFSPQERRWLLEMSSALHDP
jgi:hypothetical protein